MRWSPLRLLRPFPFLPRGLASASVLWLACVAAPGRVSAVDFQSANINGSFPDATVVNLAAGSFKLHGGNDGQGPGHFPIQARNFIFGGATAGAHGPMHSIVAADPFSRSDNTLVLSAGADLLSIFDMTDHVDVTSFGWFGFNSSQQLQQTAAAPDLSNHTLVATVAYSPSDPPAGSGDAFLGTAGYPVFDPNATTAAERAQFVRAAVTGDGELSVTLAASNTAAGALGTGQVGLMYRGLQSDGTTLTSLHVSLLVQRPAGRSLETVVLCARTAEQSPTVILVSAEAAHPIDQLKLVRRNGNYAAYYHTSEGWIRLGHGGTVGGATVQLGAAGAPVAAGAVAAGAAGTFTSAAWQFSVTALAFRPYSPLRGLAGEFYQDQDLSSGSFDPARYVTSRIDPLIDFDWGYDQRPDAHLLPGTTSATVPPGQFAVRWRGWLVPTVDGPYLLNVAAGYRAVVSVLAPATSNGALPPATPLVLDTNTATSTSGTNGFRPTPLAVYLKKGFLYPIEVDYGTNTFTGTNLRARAAVSLVWTRPGHVQEPLDNAYLLPDLLGDSAPPGVLAAAGDPAVVGQVFDLLNGIDPAATQLQIVSGASQSAPPGDYLPVAITARATDNAGHPLRNVPVTFTATNGGQLSPARGAGLASQLAPIRTDRNGLVRAEFRVPANAEEGESFTLSASIFVGIVPPTGVSTAPQGNNVTATCTELAAARTAPVSIPEARAPEVDPAAAVPEFFPPPGGYPAAVDVRISSSSPTVRYRLTPAETAPELPSGTDTLLTSGQTVRIASSATLAAQGWDARNNPSDVAVGPYQITGAITGGGAHALLLRPDRTLSVWGDQSFGRLGLGTGVVGVTGKSLALFAPPTTVPLPDVMAIAAGYDFSIVSDATGSVWTFGNNTAGQLGLGSVADFARPQQVKLAGDGSALPNIVAVTAGRSFALALEGMAGTPTGKVYAWGLQTSGALGNGFTAGKNGLPGEVQTAYLDYAASTPASPKYLPLSGIVQIAAAGTFGLALDQYNQVWAWGDNSFGQTGQGKGVASPRALPVKLYAGGGYLTDALQISAGASHAAAIRQDQTVVCWGDQSFGRVGNGLTGRGTVYGPPPAGSGSVQWATYDAAGIPQIGGVLSRVVRVACGPAHTLALDADGAVWAWGYNHDGQLGDGTILNRGLAVKVAGLPPMVAIGTGGDNVVINPAGTRRIQSFSYAIDQAGGVYAWGFNAQGELGGGATGASRNTPVALQGGVAGGMLAWYKADAGVTKNRSGQVTAWADNSGNGNHAKQLTPANSPTVHTAALNQKPAIRFDPPQWLNLPPNFFGNAPAAEAFIVIRADAENGNSGHWTMGTSPAGDLYAWGQDSSIYDGFASTSRPRLGQPSRSITSFHIYEVSSQPGRWESWMDGIPFFAREDNLVAFSPAPVLGKAIDGQSLRGDVAEFIIYPRALSDDDRKSVLAYLAQKYNLASPPIAPTSLRASTLSPGSALLTWNAGNSNAAIEYRILRQEGAGAFVQVGSVMNTGTWIDATIDSFSAYHYEVQAVNSAGAIATSAAAALSRAIHSFGAFPAEGVKLWLMADAAWEDRVTTWLDSSGFGNDALQINYGQRPTLLPNAFTTGKPALHFTGAECFPLPNFLASAAAGEIFILLRASTTRSSSGLWSFGTSSAGDLYTWYSDDNVYDGFGTTVRKQAGVPPVDITAFHVYEASSSPGHWEARFDGLPFYVDPTGTNVVAFRTDPLIGRASDGNGFRGDIAEVIVYDRVLSPVERGVLLQYFAAKYGLPSLDASGDGLSNATKLQLGLDPLNGDVNGDGLLNGIDFSLGFAPGDLHLGDPVLTNAQLRAFGLDVFPNSKRTVTAGDPTAAPKINLTNPPLGDL